MWKSEMPWPPLRWLLRMKMRPISLNVKSQKLQWHGKWESRNMKYISYDKLWQWWYVLTRISIYEISYHDIAKYFLQAERLRIPVKEMGDWDRLCAWCELQHGLNARVLSCWGHGGLAWWNIGNMVNILDIMLAQTLFASKIASYSCIFPDFPNSHDRHAPQSRTMAWFAEFRRFILLFNLFHNACLLSGGGHASST